MTESIIEQTRKMFLDIVEKENIASEEISVMAKPLTPEEAVGNPDRRDFPIIIGKERVVEAVIKNGKGHSFTDSPQNFKGTLADVLKLDLTTNQNRAIYIGALNAVIAALGMDEKTIHCKDNEPEDCAKEVAETILKEYGKIKVGLIGLNPALAEHIINAVGTGNVHITDLNKDNIGKKKFGVEVWDGRTQTDDIIDVSDLIIFTGTTLVNGSFDSIFNGIKAKNKKYLIFGVTSAGVCHLLGLNRICPKGHCGKI